MDHIEDPRLTATRDHSLGTALKTLQEGGVLAVTHGSVSKATGISRSTLSCHWPEIGQLKNHTFRRAANPPITLPIANGPVRADLYWKISTLVSVLNETLWEKLHLK